VYRFSGCTYKHFTKETEEDSLNEKHGDWEQNPVVKMKRSGAKVFISTDRVFYYSGQAIQVKMMVNMQEAKMNCLGIEMSLGRQIAVSGYRASQKNEVRKL